MKILKKKLRYSIIPFMLLVIFFEVLLLVLVNKNTSSTVAASKIKQYANETIEKCKNAPYHPSCYDKEIPKLMDSISMEDAFRVASEVQEEDESYPYCHVLGHELSAREVRKDSSKWREVITRCPSGTCSNGCLHGGLQEKFRGDSLTPAQIEKAKPDLVTLCEARGDWSPTSLEQASCYHALGHLTMYMTNANINVSIALCDELALKKNGRDWTQLCYDGDVMKMFQTLEPENFALIKGRQPTKDNVAAFGDQYPGKPKISCESEKWPLFKREIMNPDGLVAFCNNKDSETEERCFDSLFYLVTAQLRLDSDTVYNFCSNIIKDRQHKCFSNAAARMIETDYRNIAKALSLCKRAEPFDQNGKCYEQMVGYSTYNFHAGSKEFFELCNGLPEPWKNQCLLKQ
mgnify:CR=1 FL=1